MRKKIISAVALALIVVSAMGLASPAHAQLATVIWNYPGISNPPANIDHHQFYSSTMQVDVGYTVYLPPGYEASNQRYPVIYYLHGIQGNEWNYHNSTSDTSQSLTKLVESGELPPTILIFPNGGRALNYYDQGNCAQTKACPETMIIKELIPEVDAKFRTYPTKEARAIEGFSMGGMGATYLGLKYNTMFSSIAGLSSACDLLPGCPTVQSTIQNQIKAGTTTYPRLKLSYGNEQGVIVAWQQSLNSLIQAEGYPSVPIQVFGSVGHNLSAQLSSTANTGMSFGKTLGLFHWDNFGSSPTSPPPTLIPSPTPTVVPSPSASPTASVVPRPSATASPVGSPVSSPTIPPSTIIPTTSPTISPSNTPPVEASRKPASRPRRRRPLNVTERAATDVNKDSRIDSLDLNKLLQNYGLEKCDLNVIDDCRITIQDYNAVYEAIMNS
ncbi:MAG: alpha/beta hydrolase-fold protein [Microgenomates group bacterium]